MSENIEFKPQSIKPDKRDFLILKATIYQQKQRRKPLYLDIYKFSY